MPDHPDYLRSPQNIFTPDPRSTAYAVFDERGQHDKTLQDQYDAVSQITLHEGVPSKIVVKFETAKNLNLFSWFVYRFHTAARSHVSECVELALRTRLASELYDDEVQRRLARYSEQLKTNPECARPPKLLDKEEFRPTLQPLLKFAIDRGLLKNENFTAWQAKTLARARSRRDEEAIQKMRALGLDEFELDNPIQITDEDRDHDFLAILLTTLPTLRNLFAHGTSALDNHSLSALRLASEVINQLFPKPQPE